MCLICAQLESNKLSSVEARRNLNEVYTELDKKHIHDMLKLIWRKEDKEWEELADIGSD